MVNHPPRSTYGATLHGAFGQAGRDSGLRGPLLLGILLLLVLLLWPALLNGVAADPVEEAIGVAAPAVRDTGITAEPASPARKAPAPEEPGQEDQEDSDQEDSGQEQTAADDAQLSPPERVAPELVADSRVELWQGRRARKARLMEPLEENFLQRWFVDPLKWAFSRHGNYEPLLHGGHRDNSPGIGFRYEELALGHDYVRREMPDRKDFVFEATSSLDGHNHVEAHLGIHRLLSLPLTAGLTARYDRHPHDDFFGVGADSVVENRAAFLLSESEIGAEVGWDPARWLRIRGGTALLNISTGPGGGGGPPSVDQVFEEDDLPGFRDEPSFIRTHASMELDWRDSPGLPRSGGLVALRAEDFNEISYARYEFRRYTADVQGFIPFFHKHRVIALRARTVLTDPQEGDDSVPFYFMPTLGHDDLLRGFSSFRFTGRHSLLLQAEYRWTAWPQFDVALFGDAGKVFGDVDDLDLSDLEKAYGIGFRLHSDTDMLMRLDLARSDEGFRLHLGFGHVF